MERKIEFWDSKGTEILGHQEQDEAIECILDGLNELPETLEICGYARREVTESPEYLADSALEDMIERLDEEYGGEDETDKTDEMKVAAKEFATKILSLYEPWQCDIIKRETIDVDKWVKEHRPDWNE